jgi:SRSO17 transposase
LFRLQETPARYEPMQQFLAYSPWDPALLVQACAERVPPELGVTAWVINDTGIRKDGRHSPGVKRQYSGKQHPPAKRSLAASLSSASSPPTQSETSISRRGRSG